MPTADARVRQPYEHWLGLQPGPGILPGRQHFDPVVLPVSLLPLLWIDEAHPDFVGSAAYGQLVAAAERGEVGYRCGNTLIILPKDYRSMERLILPLARDGRAVDMLQAISVDHRGGP